MWRALETEPSWQPMTAALGKPRDLSPELTDHCHRARARPYRGPRRANRSARRAGKATKASPQRSRSSCVVTTPVEGAPILPDRQGARPGAHATAGEARSGTGLVAAMEASIDRTPSGMGAATRGLLDRPRAPPRATVVGAASKAGREPLRALIASAQAGWWRGHRARRWGRPPPAAGEGPTSVQGSILDQAAAGSQNETDLSVHRLCPS